MPENNQTESTLKPYKLTTMEKLAIASAAALAGIAIVAIASLNYRVGAVTSTVDQLLIALNETEIIGNLVIGK